MIEENVKPKWVFINGKLESISKYNNISPPNRPYSLCPICQDPVIMKLGEIRAYHYAHKTNIKCISNSSEGALHLNAKHHIYNELLTTKQLYVFQECLARRCKTVDAVLWLDGWDEIKIEYKISDFRPDIALLKDSKIIGAIEVFVSHAITSEKYQYFKNNNISWIEVQVNSEDFYLGDKAWKANDPLPGKHNKIEWRCSKCTSKMHELNRPHQNETFEKIIRSRAKCIIIQAPTGTGKSAWPSRLMNDGIKTLTLTKTKALQNQYRDSYNFKSLFGKGNYECYSTDPYTSADVCPNEICLLDCPYQREREKFLFSNGGSLNYPKFFLDLSLVTRFNPEYLILDECHSISDLVTDFSGIVIRFEKVRLHPPEIEKVPQPIAYSRALEWLGSLKDSLELSEPIHPSIGGDIKEYRKWQMFLEEVTATIDLMSLSPENWFIFQDTEKLICKPLTARYHFKALFDKAEKIILMSATIGNVQNFTRELGIEDFEYIEVPNIWPAPMRRVEDISEKIRLTYRSSKEEQKQHSRNIKDRILSTPENWSGIVLSPSKRLTWQLGEELYCSKRPVFIPEEGLSTEKVYQDWQDFYTSKNGAIGLFWQLWEGADLGDNDYCIVSKVPFINFREPFDKARFEYDRMSTQQRISNKMVQGLGRVRRGNPKDYGSSKMVAIADYNWTRMRNFMSKDILESIY